MNLRKMLPKLLPLVIEWAEDQAEFVIESGIPLNNKNYKVAECVGVKHPSKIRVLYVDKLPLPDDPMLMHAATKTGLIGKHTVGITLGYAVILINGNNNLRIFSHEFRHVYQYESFGSIRAFLQIYLNQIIEHGYTNAPLELDAKKHEIYIV